MATLYAPDTATNPTTVTTAANFIKELWSDEVLAVYKANTVMVPLVQSLPFSGVKGDTVHVPKPSRGSVTAKSAGTGVTIIVETAGQFTFLNRRNNQSTLPCRYVVVIQCLNRATDASIGQGGAVTGTSLYPYCRAITTDYCFTVA